MSETSPPSSPEYVPKYDLLAMAPEELAALCDRLDAESRWTPEMITNGIPHPEDTWAPLSDDFDWLVSTDTDRAITLVDYLVERGSASNRDLVAWALPDLTRALRARPVQEQRTDDLVYYWVTLLLDPASETAFLAEEQLLGINDHDGPIDGYIAAEVAASLARRLRGEGRGSLHRVAPAD